ncbi:MAG: TonB-dependent receptor [Proteobacteria bacterium]|nr:TonB-dependent receptor [Pseudomonadota bacterium]
MGRKDNTIPDGIIPPSAMNSVKYWTWPSWNKESLYGLTKNLIDDRGSFVKTRIYFDRFYNQLDSYDSIAYNTQNTPKSFNSTYDDRAAGGSAELDENLAGNSDIVRLAAHYRWDEHRETQWGRNAPAPRGPWYQQPWEKATEATWSLAAENIYHPTTRWDLTAGISYDARHLIGDSQFIAAGVTPPYGSSFSYPVSDKHALNAELAAVYRYSDDGAVHVSYADRARFPTLFEMYSTRFGTFQNNPTLKPERSRYVQIGIADTFAGVHTIVNVFIAHVGDAIIAVPLSPTLSTNDNVGVERRTGFEIELSKSIAEFLSAGVNFSHLTRDMLESSTVPVDTPSNKVFAFLDWRPVSSLKIVPSLDCEGKRWLQGATNNTLYYRGGSFTRLDLQAQYEFGRHWRVDLGVTNLTDRNYVIEDGYHAPGREYMLNLRARL